MNHGQVLDQCRPETLAIAIMTDSASTRSKRLLIKAHAFHHHVEQGFGSNIMKMMSDGVLGAGVLTFDR